MVYIKKVEGTLKQGVHATLGPKTVIYGPNGAGKSSIIQAMELATCGHVSDVEGREQVKAQGALGRLFPPDEDIVVSVELSDDSKFRWSMERQKEGSFKRPEHDCPRNIVWPVQDLKATLTGDANTVQAWLEQQVIGTISETDVLRSLPPSTHEHVRAMARRLKKYDFMALAKEAKSSARQLRTDATKLENTVEQMMQNIPLPLMSDEREDLEKRLADLEASAAGVSPGQRALWESELQALTLSYDAKAKELAALTLPTDKDFKAAVTVSTALSLLRTHAKELGLDVCWTCGNTSPDFSGHVSKLTSLEEKLKPFGLSLQKQQHLQAELLDLDRKIKAREEALALAVTVVDTHDRDTILRQLASDDSARRAWANANAQRAEVDQMRLRADQLTIASKALDKAGKDLLDRKKSEFEQQVTAFLPLGDKFVVDLDSARIGLEREGQIHSALSGAEWSRVLLALAACRSNGSTPCVLAPEDRAWDQDTLSRVMEALAKSEVQIVLMSTVKPDPVPGWTVVDLTAS